MTAGSSGAGTFYRFDNVREEVFTSEVGLRARGRTGDVSHEWVMSAAMFDLEARNAYAMSGNYAADIYRPFAAAMPDAVWLGGSMSNPNVTERTHTQSLAIADTLGFMDDRLLVTLGARRQGIEAKSYDYNSGDRLPSYNRYKNSPVAGVVYQLTDELSVYANYIEGLVKGDIAPVTSGGVTINNAGDALGLTFRSRPKSVSSMTAVTSAAAWPCSPLTGHSAPLKVSKPLAASRGRLYRRRRAAQPRYRAVGVR